MLIIFAKIVGKNERDIASIAKSSFDNIQRSNDCVDRETFDNVSSSSNHLVSSDKSFPEKMNFPFLRFVLNAVRQQLFF